MIHCEPVQAIPQDPGSHWLPEIHKMRPGLFALWPINPTEWGFASGVEEDEKEISGQDSAISGLFETYRVPFRDLFREMLRQTFAKYHIPRSGGLDIGCGPTGEMVHERLPLTNAEKRTWIESDLNPVSVGTNQRRHPNAHVQVASMYRLRDDLKLGQQRFNVISGSSSLDAVGFIDEALREVRESLKPGGFLVHFQDVRPGFHIPLEQLEREGVPHPFKGIAPYDMPLQHLNPYGYVLPSGSVVSSVELFRRWLGLHIESQSGWRLLQNEWLVAGTHTPEATESLLSLMCMKVPLNPSQTQNTPMKFAYGVMTVAQKVG